MGLKTINYYITTLGITIDTAYAKITNLFLDKDSNCKAIAGIQQTRNDIDSLNILDTKEINFVVDKTLPIYEQAYIKLKEVLTDWEDDIPETEEVLEEVIQ